MRIIETGINDIPKTNLINEKLNLADNIISYIKPIFTNEYRSEVKNIKTLKQEIIEKQKMVQINKTELQEFFKINLRKEKENQLLEKINELIQNNLIQESSKKNIGKLIQSIDKLSDEKISSYLNEIINILNKKLIKK